MAEYKYTEQDVKEMLDTIITVDQILADVNKAQEEVKKRVAYLRRERDILWRLMQDVIDYSTQTKNLTLLEKCQDTLKELRRNVEL